jgi:hypothetical protein
MSTAVLTHKLTSVPPFRVSHSKTVDFGIYV